MILIALLLATWQPLETTCVQGKEQCFADLKSTSKDCKQIKSLTASTAKGKVTVEWRRCPAPSFKTVKGADYVIVSNDDGGLWAFTNVVDPSSASVSDVGFLGGRWILVQAFAATGATASWCLLGLTPDPPRCLMPPVEDLAAAANKLIKPGETFCCKDWSLEEVTRWHMIASRPIFPSKTKQTPIGRVRATFSVNRNDLTIRKVKRDK